MEETRRTAAVVDDRGDLADPNAVVDSDVAIEQHHDGTIGEAEVTPVNNQGGARNRQRVLSWASYCGSVTSLEPFPDFYDDHPEESASATNQESLSTPTIFFPLPASEVSGEPSSAPAHIEQFELVSSVTRTSGDNEWTPVRPSSAPNEAQAFAPSNKGSSSQSDSKVGSNQFVGVAPQGGYPNGAAAQTTTLPPVTSSTHLLHHTATHLAHRGPPTHNIFNSNFHQRFRQYGHLTEHPFSAAQFDMTAVAMQQPQGPQHPRFGGTFNFYAGDVVTSPIAMPFDNGARYNLPQTWPVVKISNIPYSLTKQEVQHFLGRNAGILPPESGCAIHIIMERSTAKTMDCYVEFKSMADAQSALAWVNRCITSGRSPRLGSRHVQVEMSTQDALLKDLFPRAKGIVWVDGMPQINTVPDPYSTGFQGFFTSEEIYGVVRHAEAPHRSPFGANCLQRTYESMISTLFKFPYYAAKMFSVQDRNLLFAATIRLLTALVPQAEEGRTIGLDHRLVAELLSAGLKCPIFNERQKYALNIVAKNKAGVAATLPTSRFWPFDTLVLKTHATEEYITYYARLISLGVELTRPGCQRLVNMWRPDAHGGSPFGKIWLEYSWGNTHYTWHDSVEYEASVAKYVALEGAKARNAEVAAQRAAAPAAWNPTTPVAGQHVGNFNMNQVAPVAGYIEGNTNISLATPVVGQLVGNFNMSRVAPVAGYIGGNSISPANSVAGHPGGNANMNMYPANDVATPTFNGYHRHGSHPNVRLSTGSLPAVLHSGSSSRRSSYGSGGMVRSCSTLTSGTATPSLEESEEEYHGYGAM
ncbi:hypothetical protein AJ80_08630 [Polytolypa hystricis UAMH7299]|uniref:RRM domain-containing protein n=1 Tax=Polytolypa hystricis (strain UAMH7299) TaxID=1447883 RepID=A0A2B7X4Y6_POLH7|nr:hypothetical protein AJ80_08630 [Polytolypa hystricis UAMH7299]